MTFYAPKYKEQRVFDLLHPIEKGTIYFTLIHPGKEDTKYDRLHLRIVDSNILYCIQEKKTLYLTYNIQKWIQYIPIHIVYFSEVFWGHLINSHQIKVSQTKTIMAAWTLMLEVFYHLWMELQWYVTNTLGSSWCDVPH